MVRKRQIRSLSTWGGAHPRLQPEVWPVVTPSFTVSSGAKIFTIGSCFARNVERNLATMRFDLPTTRASLPAEEWPPADNQFLNRYTPQTIWQDMDWTARQIEAGGFDPALSEPFAIEAGDGMVIDTGFPAFIPVTRARFVERRRELFDLNRHAFSADCVTITLGLIESWLDTETGLHLHSTPTGRTLLRLGERFQPVRTQFADALDLITRTVGALKRLNPGVKILITTSPVTLSRTFTDEDIITANTHSKSVLRAVAGEVAEVEESVDYFPSFESATLTKSWDIWDVDLQHLGKPFISKIVTHLVGYYFTDVDAASVLYQKSYSQHLNGDYEGAAESIQTALAQASEDAEMLRHAAMIEQLRKNFSGAADLMERATAAAPSVPNWVALGMARMRALDRAGAQQAFREAVRLAPDNHAARFQLAKATQAAGNLEDAEQHLRIALESAPRHWSMNIEYARMALERGDYEAAIQRGLKAVEFAPPRHKERARYVVGKAHLENGDVKSARQYAYSDDGFGINSAPALQPLRDEIEALEAIAD